MAVRLALIMHVWFVYSDTQCTVNIIHVPYMYDVILKHNVHVRIRIHARYVTQLFVLSRLIVKIN